LNPIVVSGVQIQRKMRRKILELSQYLMTDLLPLSRN